MNDPSKKRGVNLPPPKAGARAPWLKGEDDDAAPPPEVYIPPVKSGAITAEPAPAPVIKAPPPEPKPVPKRKRRPIGPMIRKYRGPVAAILLLLLLLGFALWWYWPPSSLTGRVYFDGEAVQGGSVVLVGSDLRPQTAAIQEDGTFKFTKVPRGPAKLAVYNIPGRRFGFFNLGGIQFIGGDLKINGGALKLNGNTITVSGDGGKVEAKEGKAAAATAAPPKPLKRLPRVPAFYNDHELSGFRTTIRTGANKYDLDLKGEQEPAPQ